MPLAQCIKNHKTTPYYEQATLKIIQSEFAGLAYHYKRCQRAQNYFYANSNNIEEWLAGINIAKDEELQAIYQEYRTLLEDCFYLHIQRLSAFCYVKYGEL